MCAATYYLTLPSNSSLTFYPSNDSSRYWTRLAKTLSIPVGGKFKIGLTELIIPVAPTTASDVYIYCNVCGMTFVGDTYAKLLRVVRLDTKRDTYQFQQIYLHDLEGVEIDAIEIFLANEKGEKYFQGTNSRLATIAVVCITGTEN